MKNLKKLVLAAGTIATVVTPIAAVVSCGSSSHKKDKTDSTTGTTGANAKGTTGANAKGTTGANAKGTTGANAKGNTGSANGRTNGKTGSTTGGTQGNQVVSVDASKIKDNAIKLTPNQQYTNAYDEYNKSFDSYTSNMKMFADNIKKVQDKIKEVNAAAKPTAIQTFLKTILGDGTKVNVFLNKDITPFKTPTETLIAIADDSKVNTQDLADAEILKINTAKFNLREVSNKAITTLAKDVATYLKTVTGTKITAALNTLIDDVDLKNEFDTLETLITGMLPKNGPLSMVKTELDKILPKIKASLSDKAKLTEFKNNLHVIVNVIDFDKIIDKVIYYSDNGGFMLPLMTGPDGSSKIASSGVAWFSNIQGLLLGNIVSNNKQDYEGNKVMATGGIGIVQIFAMALKDASNKYYPGSFTPQYLESIKQIEKDIPAIKDISPSIRPFTDTMFVVLFGGLKGSTTPGLDEMDLNLKDSGIKDFVKLIDDQLTKAISSFHADQYLNKATALLAYGFVKANKDADGILGTILKPIAEWIGDDMSKGVEKITGLFKNVATLVDALLAKVQTISHNIAAGNTAAGYTAATTTKEFYGDLKQALIDVLSINFKTLDAAAAHSIKEIFPNFIEGTVLQNLLSLAAKKLSGIPAAVEFITKNFPGANLEASVTDMTPPRISSIGHLQAEVRQVNPTYTEDQIQWITEHQTNWDLVSKTAFGKEYKDKDGKVIPDGEMLNKDGTGIDVPKDATPFDAVFPGRTLSPIFEGRDSWLANRIPMISPTQYPAIRKAMTEGKWDYNKNAATDKATQKTIDDAFAVQADSEITAIDGLYKSQLKFIKEHQTNHKWNYLTNQPTEDQLPTPTVAEIKVAYKDVITKLTQQFVLKSGESLSIEDAIAAEIQSALKDGKWSGETFGVGYTPVHLDYPTLDEAAVKKQFKGEIDLFKSGLYAKTSKATGTLEDAIVSEIKDAVSQGKWDYSKNTFRYDFTLTKIVIAKRADILNTFKTTIPNLLKSILVDHDYALPPKGSFTGEAKLADDILDAMKAGKWDVSKKTFAADYSFNQFNPKAKPAHGITAPLIDIY